MVAAVVFAGAAPASAQQPARAVVGVAAGVGSFSRVFQTDCGDPSGQVAALSADVRVAVRLAGSLFLEGRGVGQVGTDIEECVTSIPFPPENGLLTTRRFRDDDGFLANEIGLRWSPSSLPALVIGARAGRAWPDVASYVTLAPGVRTGRRVRWALDLDLTRYRVPYVESVTEWADYRSVREVSRERHHVWRAGWALRSGLEIGVP